jgi:RecB family exonuclease
VVDLKTGKRPPSHAEVAEHAQLGLYQLAVDHGAADAYVGSSATSGGAELVQLRVGEGMPKVQAQPPQDAAPADPDEPAARLVERQLMQAVAAVRSEEFVARAGKHCDYCAFHAICPTKTPGTVLS